MSRLEKLRGYCGDRNDSSLSFVLDDDEFARRVVITAVRPARRDLWAILRGRYEPRVRIVRHEKLASTNATLKAVYVVPLREELQARSDFLDAIEKRDA